MTSVMRAKTSSIVPVPFTDASLPCAAVDVETAADDLLGGVVRAARILAAEQDALDQLLFGNVDVDHDVDLKTVSGEDFVELLGLNRGAGKTVENAALGVLVFGDVVGDHADDDLVRGQFARFDVGFHTASEFRAAADLVADNLARRDVLDAVVCFQPLRLRAFPAARRTE